MLSIHHIIS